MTGYADITRKWGNVRIATILAEPQDRLVLESETRICLKSRPETNNGIIRTWLFSKLIPALSGTFL
jgi:hypothetical protein